MREAERALLARAQEGDLDAFAEFVRVFERRIRTVLARILDDERDVDEAAQDTFVQAWRRLLSARLRALPDEARVPLVLRDLEGLSYEDVAAVLGVSVPAAKSRIHRARLQLAGEFGEWLEGEEGSGGM